MNQPPRSKAIFLSYEGYGQSYLEALYLPILESIENPPVNFHVVQFIPKNHPQRKTEAAAAQKLGIPLHFLNYYNSPPLLGTLFLLLNGFFKVGLLARREKIDFIHARTAIPGLIALGAKVFCPSVKVIFDTDGFVPEYRVETGFLNERGKMFKILKRVEKLLVEKSDLILVRTEYAKNIMSGWYGEAARTKIFVTPNGKDEEFYRPSEDWENRRIREKYNLSDDAILLVYVGTLGENFLPEKMFRLFSQVKKMNPNSFFLILSRTEFGALEGLAQAEGLSEADYRVEEVFPADIPPLISAADVGISFRAPTLSNRGISPLKVCEYLLCGTPAVVNSSIGDLETLFDENKELGYLIKETDDAELQQAAKWIVEVAKPNRESLRKAARKGGIEAFGLSNIKKLYENVYSKLTARPQLSDKKTDIKIKI